MSLIVVERSFDQPADYAELQRREDAVGFCRAAYGTKFLYSFVSADLLHMVCCYEAPDAEAVRELQRRAELPFDHLWPAMPVIDNDSEPPAGYSLVVAQRALPPGVTLEMIEYAASDPSGCGKRLGLIHIKALLSFDRGRMCCVYYSPDLESVRVASRDTGTPIERLWSGSRKP